MLCFFCASEATDEDYDFVIIATAALCGEKQFNLYFGHLFVLYMRLFLFYYRETRS